MLMLPAFFAFVANAGNVNVKVNIANPYGKLATINVNGKVYDINMDSHGTGSVNIDIKGGAFATFNYPRVMVYDMYLSEGKDIELSFDLKKRGKDMEVKCDDGGINEYLLKSVMEPAIVNDDYKLEESAFIKKVDNLIGDKVKELDSKSFSKKFKKLHKTNIIYNVATSMGIYPVYHAWYSGNKNYTPSSTYYGKLKSFVKKGAKESKRSAYRNFMNAAVEVLASEGVSAEKPIEKVTLSARYAANLKDKSLKEELIYNYTNTHISKNGVDGAEELLDIFRANVKDAEKVKTIETWVTKWSVLAKGQPSPKFNYKDINGKMVSLDDLKGKYVYIDCWATWCGPCRGEIPHLKKLEEDYHGKNIHFVSISCDSNKAAWENKVKNEGLGGIQLIIGRDRSFMDAYMVTGIPRFILIDKEGNVYDADAPRPSDPSIRKIFDSLKGL